MNKDDVSLLQKMKSLTDGLTFMSESDYPVEPFLQEPSGKSALTAEAVVASKKADANAKVSEVGFDDFFDNSTKEQDWQDAEARAQARRFQALVKALKENLSDIKVYKVGDTEADVYVVGKTASGSFAGVTTRVVET
jgi:Nuclease A inhibitor-like protein